MNLNSKELADIHPCLKYHFNNPINAAALLQNGIVLPSAIRKLIQLGPLQIMEGLSRVAQADKASITILTACYGSPMVGCGIQEFFKLVNVRLDPNLLGNITQLVKDHALDTVPGLTFVQRIRTKGAPDSFHLREGNEYGYSTTELGLERLNRLIPIL